MLNINFPFCVRNSTRYEMLTCIELKNARRINCGDLSTFIRQSVKVAALLGRKWKHLISLSSRKSLFKSKHKNIQFTTEIALKRCKSNLKAACKTEF